MTASLEDRLALQDLCTAYAYAVDRRDFDRLDEVFTADAIIDFTAMGGIVAPLPAMKPWLAENLRFFEESVHLMGNFRFTVDGDTATGEITCHNPMVFRRLVTRTRHTAAYGIWYHDTYVRTSDGWRISTRRQQAAYATNQPFWLVIGRAIVGRRNRTR